MAIDYRQSSFDYREAVYSYQGSGDATVTPTTIVCVGNVEDAITPMGYRGEYAYRDSIRNYSGVGAPVVTPSTIACTATLPEVERSLPYRETGVAYGETATTYLGDNASEINIGADPAISVVTAMGAFPSAAVSADANLSPASITCPGASVPSVTAASIVGISATTVGATGVPQNVTVLLFTEAVPASIAGVGAVSNTVVTGDAQVSATTVVGSATLPTVTSISGTASALPYVVLATSSLDNTDMARRYVPKYENTLPTQAKGELDYQPLAPNNRLARFYNARSKGINLWIVSNSTVTTTQPVSDADIANITRTLYGAHESPSDLTSTEADLLISAGYDMTVEAA